MVRLKRSGPGSPNFDGATTRETNSASCEAMTEADNIATFCFPGTGWPDLSM